MCRFAVPPRPACLLVVSFDVPGKVGVDHETDVRLVDAHAEGYGRHDHLDLVLVKGLLVPFTDLRRQPCMVRQRLNAAGFKKFRCRRDRIARRPVDDPCFSFVVLQEFQELLLDLRLGFDLVEKIGPVERGAHGMGRPEPDLADDVLLDLMRGRRGESCNGDTGERGRE